MLANVKCPRCRGNLLFNPLETDDRRDVLRHTSVKPNKYYTCLQCGRSYSDQALEDLHPYTAQYQEEPHLVGLI